MSAAKIIPFESAAALFAGLRQQGRRIVLCHGIFDLLHPGYIVHLEEARALGDLLVVSLTADKFVNKGPGRPFCKEQLRARTLAALSCVDYVVVTSFASASPVLEAVRPDVYCLGKDYEANVQKNEFLQKDLATAGKVGAAVRYAGSVIFSATKLLNHNFEHLPEGVKDFCHALAREFSMKDFREAVESFAGLKVLVMGDTIFDRYSFLKVQGLTSKNRIISGRFLHEETQCGGALAVFRHVPAIHQPGALPQPARNRTLGGPVPARAGRAGGGQIHPRPGLHHHHQAALRRAADGRQGIEQTFLRQLY